MKKKINNVIKDFKNNYKSYIIFLIIASLFFISFDYYVFTPGGLINLDDRIEIDSNYEINGSFNLTYVTAKKGTLPVLLLSYIIPSWDIEPIEESRIENESSNDIILRNQILLKETSYDAIIAAFNEANIEYKVNNIDLIVTYVFNDALTNIKMGDVIKTINGKKIENFEMFREELSKYNQNDELIINVKRDDKIIECYAKLRKEENNLIIGITVSELKDIETDPKVNYIFKNSESGASRGLMCALEIYNRITEFDLTNGDVIAGTGSIDENGLVGEVDGIKYKLKGAVRKGAKVFIVPSSNYEEAINIKRDNKYDIEIIEADNLHNVIKKLKNRNA